MRLSSRLPKGDANGLGPLVQKLLDDPEQVQVVVALVDCQKITDDIDSGDRIPTLRVRRIEGVTDSGDRERLRMILVREYERRTGKVVLPFDLEQDVRSAFGKAPGDE